MSATNLDSTPVAGALPDWLEIVRQQVASLRYGAVEIVVHDSRVIQIEKIERADHGGNREPSEGRRVEVQAACAQIQLFDRLRKIAIDVGKQGASSYSTLTMGLTYSVGNPHGAKIVLQPAVHGVAQ